MNDKLLIEKLETLAGERRGARGKAAVRVEDLDQLLRIPAKLKSAPAASTPTQDEFNALQADFAALHAQLMLVTAALQARRR
jgi:hypothetical protein